MKMVGRYLLLLFFTIFNCSVTPIPLRSNIMNLELLSHEPGGYRELKSFQAVHLLSDVTVRFCNRYVEKRSSVQHEMILAARSGLQNIAEGSLASVTSKITELELIRLARQSLEVLRLDYEDFLHQHNLPLWPYDDRRRKILRKRQCTTVDEVALWILQEHNRQTTEQPLSAPSVQTTHASLPEITANAALTLTIGACSLLDRQTRVLERRIKIKRLTTELA